MNNKKKIDYSQIKPEIETLTNICLSNSSIDPECYVKYKVNRGLRDLQGNGVLTGLTEISEIQSSKIVDGEKVSCPGQLFYRGIAIEDLVNGFMSEKRFGFEEIIYLLLIGDLPTREQLDDFKNILAGYRSLPTSFVRDIIMKAPSVDMMNTLSRSVLTLYSYDRKANDTRLPNVMRQCLQLIALFPQLAVYGYQAYEHYHKNNSLFIHTPQPELSTAENILHLLRPDSSYTELEARILDLCLVLHAEHGGGNNSTFTTHVVTSSGTDVYSIIAAALGSLKGPKHGGANIKVVEMFDDMKEKVKDWEDEDEIAEYLRKLLNKEGFDRSGLIYGMGHAIYSVSDPRAKILGNFVKQLSDEKGLGAEYGLYSRVERIAPQVISKGRKTYKGVSANIDFYSGFVYSMLNLPSELYTPIFAIARIAGWSAHLMEEMINAGKIIRPAYMNVQPRREYIGIDERKEK
ncbi:MAG: citrate/2-methylcitrate synthase [Ruminococcaceae bacterium]|nr:citrate/2-methylcitrate synthase [Oscillospiraceae bacterium]